MKLLLDTHALIWMVQSPERLGERGRMALTAADAEVYASHVSLWEMAIKRSTGKLEQLGRNAPDWSDHYVPRSGLRHLSIAVSHLGAVEGLPRLHNDPFDRLLITQAQQGELTVVTLDSHVSQYDIDVIW